METCTKQTNCEVCSEKLKLNSPIGELLPSKGMINSFRDFLVTLNINSEMSESTPPYSEETLAAVILQKLAKFEDVTDVVAFVEIFNFTTDINCSIVHFIMTTFVESSSKRAIICEELSDENSEESGDDKDINNSSEYFDTDDENSN